MSQASTQSAADIGAAQSEHEFNVRPVAPGESPTVDDRRFPRVAYRTCLQAVVFRAPGDVGEGGDQGTPCQILTRDISRGGINLLHKQQLFPGQKIDIVLTDGQQRRLEVIWCRRLGVGCFSAGCRFVKA
jgi:hypothetical protein